MIRRPPRSTQSRSSAASDVYKRQEEGNGIDPRARLVLAARGYPVPEHRARRVLPAQLFERDLVLAATSAHARRLSAIAAEAGWDRAGEPGRIALIRAFDPALTGGAGLDLDDPWSCLLYTSDAA